MVWAWVDDRFPEHPKVARAGGDAGWLWLCGLCYVQRNLTGGVIPKAVVPQLSDRRQPAKLAARLVEVGLWEDRGDEYVIHDYAETNESAERARAEAEARKRKRVERAQSAAEARWHAPPKHAPSMPQASPEHAVKQEPSMPLSRVRAGRASDPYPYPIDKSSSNYLGVVGAEAEEEDPEVNQALGLVAKRRLAKMDRSAIKAPDRWMVKAAANAWTEHADDLRRWRAEGLDAYAMADRLEPPAAVAQPQPYRPDDLPERDTRAAVNGLAAARSAMPEARRHDT